jgi:hypothetical protein
MAPVNSPNQLSNTEGSTIYLRSLSSFGDGHDLYLDGRTLEDSVGLAPTTDVPYRGTSWYAVPTRSPGEYALNCRHGGNTSGPLGGLSN